MVGINTWGHLSAIFVTFCWHPLLYLLWLRGLIKRGRRKKSYIVMLLYLRALWTSTIQTAQGVNLWPKDTICPNAEHCCKFRQPGVYPDMSVEIIMFISTGLCMITIFIHFDLQFSILTPHPPLQVLSRWLPYLCLQGVQWPSFRKSWGKLWALHDSLGYHCNFHLVIVPQTVVVVVGWKMIYNILQYII